MAADTAGGGLNQMEDHYRTFIVRSAIFLCCYGDSDFPLLCRPRETLLRSLLRVSTMSDFLSASGLLKSDQMSLIWKACHGSECFTSGCLFSSLDALFSQIRDQSYQMGTEIWLAHQLGSPCRPRKSEWLESLWTYGHHWLPARPYGICQRSTNPQHHPYHRRIYCSASIQGCRHHVRYPERASRYSHGTECPCVFVRNYSPAVCQGRY